MGDIHESVPLITNTCNLSEKLGKGSYAYHRPMLNGEYGWLEVECHRCKTRASIPLDAIRRLTQEREITPYVWVHPEEDR